MKLKETLGGEGVKAILTRSQKKKMQRVPSRIQEDDVGTKENAITEDNVDRTKEDTEVSGL
jgi:hypothetical protein